MRKFIKFQIIPLVILPLLFIISCEKDKKDTGLPTDGDGNTYDTVVIGSQVWLTENLKTTTFRNGDPIPLVTDNSQWESMTSLAYCWYNNDPSTYKDTYGALYNWYAGRLDFMCPVGYHVPTKDDWTTLLNTLRDSPDSITESFKIIRAGWRDRYGGFRAHPGCWWISSPAYDINSAWRTDNDLTIGAMPNVVGFSVRCVKDD